MIYYDKKFNNDSIQLFVIHPQSDPAKRQIQFCHNLNSNLFKKGSSPCERELPEIG